MSQFTFKTAKRRYNLIFWPMMVVYCAACIAGALLLGRLDPEPVWLAPLLALFTVLPIFVVLWLIWRYTQETDEYTRLKQLQALAIGGLVTAGASGLIGFLQLYEAIPNFPVFLLLPAFFFSYGLSRCLMVGQEC